MIVKELLDKIDIQINKIDISGKKTLLYRDYYTTIKEKPETFKYFDHVVDRWFLNSFAGVTTLYITVTRPKRG